MTFLVVTVFSTVYFGMALGRWPGLRIDRTGIALLGAIVLYAFEAIDGSEVVDAIDFPTLFVLFGLMILSAQFAASGFYDWCSAKIASTPASPAVVLALTVVVSGVLSAVLANDVVVFAMTPMLCDGLRKRGLDPRSYLIALAAAANAGSAATLIGNPQNILIGQVGKLDFWEFLAICGPPALIALIVVYAVIWGLSPEIHKPARANRADVAPPPIDRIQLARSAFATVALLALFATPLPQVSGVLSVSGFLLISRKLSTRSVLGLVDWHLLVLFAGLFVVTAALTHTGLPARALAGLEAAGLSLQRLSMLAPLTLVGSNTIGNVPLVMLFLTSVPNLPHGTLCAVAVLSTLAGNLFLVGSLANIIMVERAREAGVVLIFAQHARCGVPITAVSFVAAVAWLWLGTHASL